MTFRYCGRLIVLEKQGDTPETEAREASAIKFAHHILP